jgi:hypothetical protein
MTALAGMVPKNVASGCMNCRENALGIVGGQAGNKFNGPRV